MVHPPLALVLLRASRWFDAELLKRLEADGWPRLSSAQSLVFAYLPEDGLPPAELARRLGTTRQAAHQLVAGLCRLGLLAVADDGSRRRGRVVVLSATGEALASDARRVLADLERALGTDRVIALHELLDPIARGRIDGAEVPRDGG